MKFKYFILVFAGILVIAFITQFPVNCGFNCINGSGSVNSESRDLEMFNQLHLAGKGNVVIHKGNEYKVDIEADDNLLEIINTEVKNGELRITYDRCVKKETVLTYHVTVLDLNALSVSGSGQLKMIDEFIADDLKLKVSGSGKMLLKFQADDVETDISGSGDITLFGEADKLDLRISGSGDYDGLNMKVKSARAKISGSGEAYINVEKKLIAKVSGSGDIHYKGSPKVRSKISGSGEINAVD